MTNQQPNRPEYSPVPNQPQYYPQPQPKKSKKLLWIIIAVLALLGLLCGVAVSASGGDKDNRATGVVDVPATPESKTKSTAKNTKPKTVKSFGEGTYEVGSEIEAGTYVTVAPNHCYWERLKDFDGEFDSIIANDNLDEGAKGRVNVKKSDAGIKFQGDCKWTKK